MNKMKKKWLFPLMLVLVVSLAITGCTKEAQDDVKNTTEDAKDTTDKVVKDAEDDVRDMTYEDIKVTPAEAFDKFMELHPDTKINKIDLDKELMEYQYVVEGYDSANGYEVKINPVDGTIVSDDTEVEDMDDETAEITKEHLSKVDMLIEKAELEDASDSRLDEWDIYVEDGKVIIEIEIGMQKYSYDMDTEELIK